MARASHAFEICNYLDAYPERAREVVRHQPRSVENHRYVDDRGHKTGRDIDLAPRMTLAP